MGNSICIGFRDGCRPFICWAIVGNALLLLPRLPKFLILKGTLFSAQVKMKAFPIHREVIVCRRRDCDQAGAIRVEI